MRNFKVNDFTPKTSRESTDRLDVLSKLQGEAVAEEDLKDIWKFTKERVLLMFGHHDAMCDFIDRNMNVFTELDPDAAVRTVTPEDLETAMSAIEKLNEVLAVTRKGETVNLHQFIDSSMVAAGIELREDGVIYPTKFLNGNWGAGKGLSNVTSPMEFKKTIDDFGWNNAAGSIARRFVNAVKSTDRAKMVTSIDRHYSDLTHAVKNVQEKGDVKIAKRVALNQMRNVLSVRNKMIKFVFKQLRKVLKAAPSDAVHYAGTKVPDDAGMNDW